MSAEAQPVEASMAEICSVIDNERRRLVIECLHREAPLPLRELSLRVAAHENDKATAEVTGRERKRAYVGLYQNHLDKLEAVGVIETAHQRLITRGARFRDFGIALTALESVVGGEKP